MKIIISNPGDGGADELLLWLLEGHAKGKNRVLIVPTEGHRLHYDNRLCKLWHENKHDYINNAANSIFTIERWNRERKLGKRDPRVVEMAVSNADKVLAQLLGGSTGRVDVLAVSRPDEVVDLRAKTPENQPLY